MLIEKTLLGEINKEEKAIDRIKYFQNKTEGLKKLSEEFKISQDKLSKMWLKEKEEMTWERSKRNIVKKKD